MKSIGDFGYRPMPALCGVVLKLVLHQGLAILFVFGHKPAISALLCQELSAIQITIQIADT